MSHSPSEHDVAVWERLAEADSAYLAAAREFYSEEVDRVALVRWALRKGRCVQTVCRVLKYMSIPELERLFDVLVEWASTGHGLIQVFRDAILRLPRDWVVANIEATAEPFLRQGTDDEYRRFLELYLDLDRDLTAKLARRAAVHPDEDIREAGNDYLETLGIEDRPQNSMDESGHKEQEPEGSSPREVNSKEGVMTPTAHHG
jgi:hypothetical protein